MARADWEKYLLPEDEEPDFNDLIQIGEGVYKDEQGNIYMDTAILEEKDRKLAEKQAQDKIIYDEMNRRAAEIAENPYIKLSDIVNPDFMMRNSKLKSFRELLAKTGYNIFTIKDLEDCPDDALDKAVQEWTVFSSWIELQERALNEFYLRQIYGRPEDRLTLTGDPSDPGNYGI